MAYFPPTHASEIDEARSRVQVGGVLIKRQKDIIAELVRERRNAKKAREIMNNLETSQRLHQKHLRLLLGGV